MVGVYVRGDMEEKMEAWRAWGEEEGGRKHVLIGGDFNARTGEKGGGIRGGWEEIEEGRRSMDKIINRSGELLLNGLSEAGWEILNGGIEGDEKGNWTYIGGEGMSVIDYIVVNDTAREEVLKMEVGDQVDSDHLPLGVWIRAREEKRGIEKKRKEKRWMWSKEGKEEFKKELGTIDERGEGVEVEVEWKRMSERIRKVLEKEQKEGVNRRKEEWFDTECREAKREVRRELRK